MSVFVNEFLKYFLTNPLVIFIFISSIICILYEKEIIGWLGEHWTKQSVNKLPTNRYRILNDILISTGNSTHQIDHIVVSIYGIFCIETKQFNGFITGSKHSKNWTRYYGERKYNYPNPIKQNYGHVKALSQLLNIDESKIFNIVCIPSRAKLRIQHDGELVRYDTINDKILSYKEPIINNVDEIIDIIIKSNIKDKNIKKEHINNIRNNANNNYNKCPKCGGKLVNKKGKYGYFIGCSNYPECNYTRSVK
ncbi:MAG: NERD domain-containing protein [Bacilli bacterium]|nr:NERD domain-containing protein [Bacilli bacterium]